MPIAQAIARAAVLGLVAAALSAPVAVAAPWDIERVSVATGGAEGNDDSTAPSISGDGSVVAFQSRAGNLVNGDANGGDDVFARVRPAGRTERVSGGPAYPGVSAGSTAPAISADGTTVAFESLAPELGDGIFGDIFLRQRGGTIVRVTAPNGNGDNVGGTAPSISADGSRVAFQSATSDLIPGDENGNSDVFTYRLGQIRRLSEGLGDTEANSYSGRPAISGDGRFVAFVSHATNLTVDSHDDIQPDIFVSAVAGGTQRVSRALGGGPPNGFSDEPAISGDGSVVAFMSSASNLVAGDRNNSGDVFVYDRNTHATKRVSVASDGTEADDHSLDPSVSANGRFVAFVSYATNLDTGPRSIHDVFVHDRRTGVTENVSLRRGAPVGVPIGGGGKSPSISADGCVVAFETDGFSTYFLEDTNGAADVHVVELGHPGCGSPAAPAPDRPTPTDDVASPPARPAPAPVAPEPERAQPVAGRTEVVEPVRGTVRVRARGTRRFVELRRGTAIPDGSEIDATRGAVRLVVATRRGSDDVATAEVSGGRAIVDQDARRRPTTTLTLSGPLPCRPARRPAQAGMSAARARRLVVRAGNGRFRTRTRRAAATGRRSAWLTKDHCDGTVTRVVRGKVAVEDFVRHRTVFLRARGTYRASGSGTRRAER